MKDYTRIDVSKCTQIKGEFDIPGNCTSLRGEFRLPGTDRTAFYKEDGCMLVANNDESYREMLASEILDILNVPHANISLGYDSRTGKTGCFSHSILGENESFIDRINDYKMNRGPIHNIEDFLNNEVSYLQRFDNVTPQLINQRKKIVLNQIFADCILGNYDISGNNMQMIYNNRTGTIRSAECYDFGTSFTHENFNIGQMNYESMMNELYTKYFSEIKDLAKTVNDKLTPETLSTILSNPIYKEGFKENMPDIIESLNYRIKYSNERFAELYKPPIFSVQSIGKACSNIGINLIDSTRNLFNRLLNRDKLER